MGELFHQPERLRKRKKEMFRVYLDTPASGEILYYEGDSYHLAESAFNDFREKAFEVRMVEII